MNDPEIMTVPSVAEAAVKLLLETAEATLAERDRFLLILSGGSTPLAMFDLLAEKHAQDSFWMHTHIYWADERFVPYEHPQSNFGTARARLLDHITVPDTQLFPWPYTLNDPQASADEYAETVSDYGYALNFDLCFLGLGDDAHTASLFPGTKAVHADTLTTVVEPEGKDTRLSLTVGTLNHSLTTAFLVSGEGKRAALEATLHAERDLDRYPAQAIRAMQRTLFITDLEL